MFPNITNEKKWDSYKVFYKLFFSIVLSDLLKKIWLNIAARIMVTAAMKRGNRKFDLNIKNPTIGAAIAKPNQ